MARVESYGRTEARQKLRDWISEALPIVSWQFVQIGDLRVPIVQVEVRNRPDVADLARVQMLEGPEGDVWSQWILVGGQVPLWALLEVEIRRPVRCPFRLAFRSDKHRQLLKPVAQYGLLGVATGPLHIQKGMLHGPAIIFETANAAYVGTFLVAAGVSDMGKVA